MLVTAWQEVILLELFYPPGSLKALHCILFTAVLCGGQAEWFDPTGAIA
jgi:hypothetical protein